MLNYQVEYHTTLEAQIHVLFIVKFFLVLFSNNWHFMSIVVNWMLYGFSKLKKRNEIETKGFWWPWLCFRKPASNVEGQFSCSMQIWQRSEGNVNHCSVEKYASVPWFFFNVGFRVVIRVCPVHFSARDLGPTVQETLLALHVFLNRKRNTETNATLTRPFSRPTTGLVQVQYECPDWGQVLARVLQWLEQMS